LSNKHNSEHHKITEKGEDEKTPKELQKAAGKNGDKSTKQSQTEHNLSHCKKFG